MKRSGIGLLLVVLAAFVAAPFSLAVDAIDFSKGAWHRAALGINDENEIPFLLWLPAGEGDAVIRNGDEDIRVKFERRPPGNWHDAMHGFVLDFPHYDSRIEAELDLTYHYRGRWRKGEGEEAVTMSFVARRISQPPSEFIRIFNEFVPERAAHTFVCINRVSPSPIIRSNYDIQFETQIAASLQIERSVSETGRVDVERRTDFGVPATAILQMDDGRIMQLSGVSGCFGAPTALSFFDGAEAHVLHMEWDAESNSMRGDYHNATVGRTFVATRPVKSKPPVKPVSPY